MSKPEMNEGLDPPEAQNPEKKTQVSVEEFIKTKIPKNVSFEIDGIRYENFKKNDAECAISADIFNDHVETNSGMRVSLIPKSPSIKATTGEEDCSIGTDTNDLWFSNSSETETDNRSYEDIIYDDSKDEEKIAQIRRQR
jgi:hypothetical protein